MSDGKDRKPEPTARIPSFAGWTDGKQREVCRCGCGQAIKPPRRTFATAACVRGWKIRTNPGFARNLVWNRDHGICAVCQAKCLKKCIAGGVRWHADHIVPVVEGGADLGLDNLRTLCEPCHKQVTAELRKRLAEQRKAAQAV